MTCTHCQPPLPAELSIHVRRLRHLARRKRQVQALGPAIKAAAQAARIAGLSVAQIAAALGCSRMHAHTLVSS